MLCAVLVHESDMYDVHTVKDLMNIPLLILHIVTNYYPPPPLLIQNSVPSLINFLNTHVQNNNYFYPQTDEAF